MFTIPSVLLARESDFEKVPEAAFVRGNEKISRERFRRAVARISARLRENPAKNCVVHSDDNFEFALGLFSALHAGKRLIFPHNMQPRMLERLAEFSPAFLSENEIRAELENAENADAVGAPVPELKPFPRETEISFFSSGSTGTPKLIEKIWGNIEDEIVRLNAFLPKFSETPPTVLASVHTYHIYGMLYACLIPLCRGWAADATLVQTPEEVFAKAVPARPLYFVSSPAFLSRWTRDRETLRLRVPGEKITILSSGSLLESPTSDAVFAALATSPLEVYGSTETGGVAFRRQAENLDWTIWDDEQIALDAAGALTVRTPLICENAPFTLGDAAEIRADGKHFKLLGRTNRLVKIEDKRVSLPELEEDLKRSPLVADAHLVVLENSARKSIGALVALSALGEEKILSAGGVPALSSELKKFLSASVDSAIVPRKWRYCRELPRNTMGKLLRDEIAAFFATKMQEPLILDFARPEENRVEMRVVFPPKAAYFQGHFPTFALLPGVAQLHFVSIFAQRFLDVSADFKKISRLKFKTPLLPGEPATLTLTKTPGRLSFVFADGERIFSQGAFVQ